MKYLQEFHNKYFYLIHFLILIIAFIAGFYYSAYEVPVTLYIALYSLGIVYGVIGFIFLIRGLIQKNNQKTKRAIFLLLVGGLIFYINFLNTVGY